MNIRTIILLIAYTFVINISAQQNTASIKQQMAKIRQSTNWEDPNAAKKANEQIRELSKQLMMAGNPQGNLPGNLSKEEAEKAKKDAVDEKMKLWSQVMKSASGGKGADIFLAEPIREEIKAEYREEELNKYKNKECLEDMTFLCINMSSPTVQLLIDQMENYKSVNTLVITSGKNESPVDLETLMAKAANYPLQNLYIINFKSFVTSIPKSVANFSKLTCLAVYNNKISSIPTEINSMNSLKKLYVDMNPLSVISPSIVRLNNLDTLGIAKTQITQTELNIIRQKLPDCKILLQ